MMSNKPTAIYWMRQDLRIADNPALKRASSEHFLAVYIYDDVNSNTETMIGEASAWWLYNSLDKHNSNFNSNISFFRGDAVTILQELCESYGIKNVFWNRCYEPWRIDRDSKIKESLTSSGINCESHNASLLWEPWEIYKDDKTPYLVFTPFFKKGCLNASPPRYPLGSVDISKVVKANNALDLDEINILPKNNWHKKFDGMWNIGEHAAYKKLEDFVEDGLVNYKDGRNFPSQNNVSRLSPHLHFGEISPNQIWYMVDELDGSIYPERDVYHFKSEIGWREFSYSLLYYNQQLQTENLYKKFDKFPWKKDISNLQKWKRGLTGYPIVDAGMRELWETGYMHNRLRMVVGSFLVKNLLIHWNHGERWFWDCLIDADMASNSASWQWVAGSGADAAPYFRIFNPIMQGQKFDPDGTYTKKYIPELANVPLKYLFNPWDAPKSILDDSGVTLGKDYPYPIVNMQESRDLALDAFDTIRIK